MASERVSERRWIVLSTDGRHTTLGRHSDPTPEEISRVERSLIAGGLAGWLVVMEGDYYTCRSQPNLVMICPLAEPTSTFKDATAAFEDARVRAQRL